jgi:MFS family permease
VCHKDLQEAVRRFNFWIGVGFALTPVLGFGTAVLFGLIEIRELQRALASGILPGFLILLLTWTLVHFRKFLAPLLAWVTRHPEGVATPPRLYRRFSGFSRDYWGLFLIYALATPTLYFASLHQPLSGATLTTFTHLLIVQVGVAILMGIPGYFIALDQLGRLAGKLDLQKVQVSLKSKMMLVARAGHAAPTVADLVVGAGLHHPRCHLAFDPQHDAGAAPGSGNARTQRGLDPPRPGTPAPGIHG